MGWLLPVWASCGWALVGGFPDVYSSSNKEERTGLLLVHAWELLWLCLSGNYFDSQSSLIGETRGDSEAQLRTASVQSIGVWKFGEAIWKPFFGGLRGTISSLAETHSLAIGRKKEVLKKLLGITKTSPMQSYLGISPLTRRPSRNEFKATVSRVENRLQGWKAQLLTFAGRLTLIKKVTAGISNHRMSSFKIPLSTVDHLESLQRDFLWSNGNKGKIYAVNWQTVCQPLDEGGLGIRSLYLT